MSEAALVLVDHDDHVTTLTLNRPAKLNALSEPLLERLEEALQQTAERAETRCVLLTGAGEKAFVAGADIAAMKSMKREEAKAFSERGHRVMDRIEAFRCPVIAVVNGFALGGGLELALACDFIHASDKARLGQPEVSLGVIPGFGGTQRLARRVGIANARELIYTGATPKADEAWRLGLVNAVHASDALMAAAKDVATRIAEHGPLAVRAAKQVLAEGEGKSLADANALEVEAFAKCFDSADQKEGMEAFVGKRSPTFKGA